MKIWIRFIVVVTCVLVFFQPQAVAENRTIELQGEWQLLSAELTVGQDTFPIFNPKTHKMTKIFTDSHFAFVSKGPQRPRFNSVNLTAEEKVLAFDNFGSGGGRYSLQGNHYSEQVEYCHFPNYEGMTFEFTLRLDGDLLTQQGSYPLKALGLGEQDGYLKEVYRRVD